MTLTVCYVQFLKTSTDIAHIAKDISEVDILQQSIKSYAKMHRQKFARFMEAVKIAHNGLAVGVVRIIN